LSAIRTLLAPCSVSRTPPLNYREDAGALSYLLLDDSWTAVDLHEFFGAYASPYGVVFRGGSVEAVSLDYSMVRQRNNATFVKKIAAGRVRHAPGTCVVANNAFFINYYHWLLEALPRLYCVRDEVRNASLILCDDVTSFHRETLALFECGNVMYVRRDELVRADTLLLPEPVSPRYGQHNPKLLREFADWMRRRVGRDDGRRNPGRRIYVVRGQDKRRRAVNDVELDALLAAHGFEPVVLERLSVAEQVALFGQAEAVASLHGAGLSNMLFMPPGGAVIELVSDRYPDGCLFNLAAACGHRSVVLPCETVGARDRSGPKYYDMRVDIAKCRQCLERLGL